jgi:hypothetical protein
MASLNIIRKLPTIEPELVATHELQPMTDPEWEHLSLIYQLIIRLVTQFPSFPGFTVQFANSLIPQLLSPDTREQSQIIAFIELYLDSHDSDAPRIMGFLLNGVIHSQNLPNFPFLANATFSMLPFVSVIGDARSVLMAQLPNFLRAVFAAPTLHLYQASLFAFLTSKLMETQVEPFIVDLMLSSWPVVLPIKQACYFRLLGALLRSSEGQFSRKRVVKLMKLIADGAGSTSTLAASAALAIFIDNALDSYVARHSRFIYPVLCPPFMEAAMVHWSPDVRELARRALSWLNKADPAMFQEMAKNPRKTATTATAGRTWQTICKRAGLADPALLAGGKLTEIFTVFSQEKRGSAEVLRRPPNRIAGSKSNFQEIQFFLD